MIKPILKKVLIEVEKEETKSASGIIMPESMKKESMRGRGIVIAVGDEVKSVSTGQKVLFTKEWDSELVEGGKVMALINYENVLAIIE